MATDFQTKEVKGLGTTWTNLTGSFVSGEVTVHAIYISNKHANNTIGFYLSLYNNNSGSVDTVSDSTPTPNAAWEEDQTHSAFVQTSTSGSGTGATFSVVTDVSGNPTFTLVASGSGYAVNDTIVYTDPHENTDSTATLTVATIASDEEMASILYNVEVAPKSTLVIEKPINLTASSTGVLRRQLKVRTESDTDIDVVASVLVIT